MSNVPELLRPALCRECGGGGVVYNPAPPGIGEPLPCLRCRDHPGVDSEFVHLPTQIRFKSWRPVIVIPLGGANA